MALMVPPKDGLAQEQKLKGRKKIVPFTRLVGIRETHN
jgi:hypothetical protein